MMKTCPWGWCTVFVDPATGREDGTSVGPIMCPCDHLPGWRASSVAEMSKPPVPALPRGRHGSRVDRSRKRHLLPDFSAFGEWLPARSLAQGA